jgi:peptidoglycan/xylan/chitin deacetylase (PgdA/CDA1 family)
MNFSGGLSLMAHILINTCYKIARMLSVNVRSVFIVFFVLAFSVFSASYTLKTFWQKNNNVELVREAIRTCEQVSPAFDAVSGRVVLRVDDVQAFAYRDVTRSLLADADTYDTRLVLGVIPKGILEDEFIQGLIRDHSCNVELALHGWDHSSGNDGSFEFEKADETAAREIIRKGKEVVEQLTDTDPVTFIPPGNEVSDGAKKALESEGIRYLSADNTDGEFGMDATTYDFPNKKMVEVPDVLKGCDKKFAENKTCIIVLHPQDYLTGDAIDPEKYAKYIELLTTLRDKSLLTVTFRD